MTALVEMRGITKRFPGVLANDHVDFVLEAGEIHALLGENGAGKTTLMNILYGLYQPDEGEIYVKGRPATIHSPHDAIQLGIGMVHQHFQLVPTFTVAENIVLGLPSRREPFLESRRRVHQQIAEVSRAYGLAVDPSCLVWQLSVGEQQRVEILKALYRGATVLILDEPTAVLTPQECERLFEILLALVQDGKSVIFISHKLDEVMAISHRVTVLRDGRVVGTARTQDITKQELARMMVGREMCPIEKPPASPAGPVIALQDIWAHDDRGLPALRGVSLEVCAGEILGIAGVDGNGQAELEEVLTGLRHPHRGRYLLAGQDVTHASARELFEAGLAHIPADRNRFGMVADMTLAENSILGLEGKPPFTRFGMLRYREMEQHCSHLIREYDIRAPGPAAFAGTLSGGNAQKLILAREISRRPKALVAAQPTRGLDIGATEYVRRKLLEQRERGCGVLLISTELEEILALSDRIAVIYEGQIVGMVDPACVDIEQLGLMMAGAIKEACELPPRPPADRPTAPGRPGHDR
ncbi:MAG: ABC transporter ATP-binding protein [Anaerolineae bacterium]|nr:ABC transporter ATP-binding protein [Anaerolineae bacterium]